MKIVLSGGAGFIGSHLADLLVQQGHSIKIVDNLSTGSIENIRFLLSKYPERVKFINASAEDHKKMEEALRNCDIFYHLAATVGVSNVMKDTISTIRNNIHATEVGLELCKKLQVKRVVLFSTSEVYGKNTLFPYSESHDVSFGNSKKLRWSYAVSKFVDEFLGFAYYENESLPVTIVRLFNTIGVRQVGHYGMVVPRFCLNALNNEDLLVYGNGSQTRCFTDVRDVVQILSKLVLNEKAVGEIINIGNNLEISILDLALMIIEKTKSKSRINFKRYEEVYGTSFEDMPRRVPDNRKVIELTGHRFEHKLEETIMWIISSMKSQNKQPHSHIFTNP